MGTLKKFKSFGYQYRFHSNRFIDCRTVYLDKVGGTPGVSELVQMSYYINERMYIAYNCIVRSYHIETSVLSSSRLRFSNDSLSSSIRPSDPTPLSGDESIVTIIYRQDVIFCITLHTRV